MNRFVLKNIYIIIYIYSFPINIFIEKRSQSRTLETVFLSQASSNWVVAEQKQNQLGPHLPMDQIKVKHTPIHTFIYCNCTNFIRYLKM
jgi:hypothetical protein